MHINIIKNSNWFISNRFVLSVFLFFIFGIGITDASEIQWFDYTGIQWHDNTGTEQSKPIMIYFYESSTFVQDEQLFKDQEVVEAASKFVCIQTEIKSTRNMAWEYKKSGFDDPSVYFLNDLIESCGVSQSSLIFLNKDKQIIERIDLGSIDKSTLLKTLLEAWNKKDTKGETITERARIQEKTKYLNYINMVNSEINNITSIGGDTKAAFAKLEEAKRALSKGDYNNVSLFASDAHKLALTSNIGFVSIKDLISSKTINVPKSKYDGHTVETAGLIRNIQTSGARYNFVIDDGNGVISVAYSGGLGDIKEGDSVSVKGVYNSQNINAESVSKGNGLAGGLSSNVKAPGFEAILAISIIGALWLRRKL